MQLEGHRDWSVKSTARKKIIIIKKKFWKLRKINHSTFLIDHLFFVSIKRKGATNAVTFSKHDYKALRCRMSGLSHSYFPLMNEPVTVEPVKLQINPNPSTNSKFQVPIIIIDHLTSKWRSGKLGHRPLALFLPLFVTMDLWLWDPPQSQQVPWLASQD